MRKPLYLIFLASTITPMPVHADSASLLSAINQVQLGTQDSTLFLNSSECVASDIPIWSHECTLKSGSRVLVQLAPDRWKERLLSQWSRSIRNRLVSGEDAQKLKNKTSALKNELKENGLPITVRALRIVEKGVARSDIEKIAYNFSASNRLGPIEKSRHYKSYTRADWYKKDEQGNPTITESTWISHMNWDTKNLMAFSEPSDDNREDYELRYGWMDIDNKWPYDKPTVDVVLTAYTGEVGVSDRITAIDPKKDYGWITRLLDIVFPWRYE